MRLYCARVMRAVMGTRAGLTPGRVDGIRPPRRRRRDEQRVVASASEAARAPPASALAERVVGDGPARRERRGRVAREARAAARIGPQRSRGGKGSGKSQGSAATRGSQASSSSRATRTAAARNPAVTRSEGQRQSLGKMRPTPRAMRIGGSCLLVASRRSKRGTRETSEADRGPQGMNTNASAKAPVATVPAPRVPQQTA